MILSRPPVYTLFALSLLLSASSHWAAHGYAAEGPFGRTVLDSPDLALFPIEDRSSLAGLARHHVWAFPAPFVEQGILGATSQQSRVTFEGFEVVSPLPEAMQTFGSGLLGRLNLQGLGQGAALSHLPGGTLNLHLPELADASMKAMAFGTRPFLASDGSRFQHETGTAAMGRAELIPRRLALRVGLEGVETEHTNAPGIQGRELGPRASSAFRAVGRVDGRISDADTLSLILALHRGSERRIPQLALVENIDTFDRTRGMSLLGMGWDHRFSPSVIWITRTSFQEHTAEESPAGCDPRNSCQGTIEINPVISAQTGEHSEIFARTMELSSTLQASVRSGALGHELQAEMRLQSTWRTERTRLLDDRVIVFDGATPFLRLEQGGFTEGGLVPGRFESEAHHGLLSLSFQDELRWETWSRLSLKPGVGVVGSKLSSDKAEVALLTVVPHVDVRLDVTSDGKTWWGIGYHEYVDPGDAQVANFLTGGPTQRLCDWDENTRSFSANCRIQGGPAATTVALPCGPDGFDSEGNRCRGDMGMPRMKEWLTTAGRRLGESSVLEVHAFLRNTKGSYEDRNTNFNYDESGALDAVMPTRNGRLIRTMDVALAGDAERLYKGLSLNLRGKTAGFRWLGGYVLSRMEGNVERSYGNTWLDNPSQNERLYGPLPEDTRHALRLHAARAWQGGVSLGVAYSFFTGTPLSQLSFDPVTARFDRLSLPRDRTGPSLRPGAPTREFRQDSVQTLGLRVRYALDQALRVPVAISLEALNIWGGSRDVATQTYAQAIAGIAPLQEQPARRVRLTVEAWF